MWLGKAFAVSAVKLMEAIVLAGGFGTRLREVIDNVPKPMAPIRGRPFLEILLSSLAQKGFSRVVLSIGYMATVISDHFGNTFKGMEIAYAIEDTPLGTGGALRLALEACAQERVFVFNGDTYLDLEVEQLSLHWNMNQKLIVVGRCVPDTFRYGRLILEGNQISAFAEKGIKGKGLINAGCYVVSKNLLDGFPVNKAFSFEEDFLMNETCRSRIDVFVTNGRFIDIGIPEDYWLAQTLLSGL